MKITTAALISMLALGSTIAFAQNSKIPVKVASPETHSITINAVLKPLVSNAVPIRVASPETHSITINAVLKPLVSNTVPVKVASPETHSITINAVLQPLVARSEAKSESDEFHVNRSAAISATLQSRLSSRQLQSLPVENGSVLNALTAR